MTTDQVFPSYQELLQESSVTVVQNQVTAIDLSQKQVTLSSGQPYSYVSLVLAVGSIQSYFGTMGGKDHAFPFRQREDAIALEQHLKQCLQRAKQTGDEAQRRALLTVAIVGAGPTGVEMAATLGDLLPYWYDELGGQLSEIRIVLLNHGRTILTGDINTHLKQAAYQAFKTRTVPVELFMSTGVKAVAADHLEYQRQGHSVSETLQTYTTIWTAGTATNPLIQSVSAQLAPDQVDQRGLPLVTPTLQLLGLPEVFAAGDCAVLQDQPLPPVAQVAYQQGTTIARNLLALSRGESLHPVDVQLRGTMMKLGLDSAVANLFDKVPVSGNAGDLIRSGVYLDLLPTPSHNFRVMKPWLREELFHIYHRPSVETKSAPSRLSPIEQQERTFVKALAIAAPIFFLIATGFALRTPPSERLQPTPATTTQPAP